MPHPRSRDADRSRGAILDAAEALFAEQGYHPTSLAGIGERARVSRGTPGYFFGSKDALYRAVLQRCFTEALETVRVGRLRAERSGQDRDAVLAGVVGDYLDFAEGHPHFVHLMHREALGEGPDNAPSDAGFALGREAVAALAEELHFPAGTREAAAQLALSLLALTWFPVLHRRTMVPAVGLDRSTSRFRARRKAHITTLLSAALPRARTAQRRRTP